MKRDALLPFAIVGIAALALLGPKLPEVRAGEKNVNVGRVHGKIQFVTSFPDYKVQVVDSFPDFTIQDGR